METTTVHQCEDLRILRTEAPARCVCAECGQVYELRNGQYWKVTILPSAPHISSVKPFPNRQRGKRQRTRRKGSRK